VFQIALGSFEMNSFEDFKQLQLAKESDLDTRNGFIFRPLLAIVAACGVCHQIIR